MTTPAIESLPRRRRGHDTPSRRRRCPIQGIPLHRLPGEAAWARANWRRFHCDELGELRRGSPLQSSIEYLPAVIVSGAVSGAVVAGQAWDALLSLWFCLVGVAGFEPATPSSRTRWCGVGTRPLGGVASLYEVRALCAQIPPATFQTRNRRGCYLVATRHCSMGRQATIGNIYLCNQLLLARPKRFELLTPRFVDWLSDVSRLRRLAPDVPQP